MTEFVITPTAEWLTKETKRCESRLLVSSPYVGNWLSTLIKSLSPSVHRMVLTRTDLRDFASGASDLDAVCAAAECGAEIHSASRLHAKVYVIDRKCALVTSANATFSGMFSNLECGVATRKMADVNRAAEMVMTAFGADQRLQRWTAAELKALREPVRELRSAVSTWVPSESGNYTNLVSIQRSKPFADCLAVNLPGWTKLALEGIQNQKTEVFDLNAFVAACIPLVNERYPNNRNVRAKLRQQLQRLRDLGVIEFLGNATYRRES